MKGKYSIGEEGDDALSIGSKDIAAAAGYRRRRCGEKHRRTRSVCNVRMFEFVAAFVPPSLG